jgi:K+-sensing histidine kinase KdpD
MPVSENPFLGSWLTSRNHNTYMFRLAVSITGQGLALVHSSIVKGHSGKIWIESPPGKGAAFVIQLPLETLVGTEKTAPEREPTSVPE